MKADELEQPGQTSTSVRTLLVHGTWPKGLLPSFKKRVRWFEDGSHFRKQLVADLNSQGISTEIDHFPWTGENSIIVRERAAVELAAKIKREYSNSDQPLLIIAHSHGGNVVARCLSHLENGIRIPFLVTLATPFVEILPLSRSADTRKAAEMAAMMPAVAFTTAYGNYWPDLCATLGTAATVAAGIVAFGLLLVIGSWWLGSGNDFHFAYTFRQPNAIPSKLERLSDATRLDGIIKLRRRLLVLRAVDDEAALVLAAASIGNFLTSTLAALQYRHIWKIVAAVLTLGGLAYALDLNFLVALLLIVFGILVIPGVLGFPLLLLAGVFKSVYGRELLFGSTMCEINSQGYPDATLSTALTVKLSDSFRHKLPENPACPIMIAIWLEGRLAERDLD